MSNYSIFEVEVKVEVEEKKRCKMRDLSGRRRTRDRRWGC